MKKKDKQAVDVFIDGFSYCDQSSDVSTSEVISNDELTEEEKAIAWSEFEYQMQMLNREDN